MNPQTLELLDLITDLSNMEESAYVDAEVL